MGKEKEETFETRTAEEYVLTSETKEDELVIGSNLKGVDYTLSKCCNPIYGDDIFGFVSTQGTIKVHRKDCPNAPQMFSRFRYRIINARWSGKQGSQYVTVLRGRRKRRYRNSYQHNFYYLKREKCSDEKYFYRL